MRGYLAGIITLLLLASGASAQVTGFVESIGIQNRIRPDCWNPLVVNLTSQISDPATYQIQVWQNDLDKDRVVFTKDVTLSPKLQQKFETYFVPQPTDGGLPTAPMPAGLLQKELHVRLCLPQAEGRRPEDAKVVLERLGINYTVASIDPPQSLGSLHHGTRVVLWVTDNSSKPSFGEYKGALGLAESVETVAVHPEDLGENALFYDAVDAVVWLSGNADNLDQSGARRKEALEEWVRGGGKLIVCQPSQREKIAALADLLPIESKDASGAWTITFGDLDRLDDAKDPLPRMSASPAGVPSHWTLVKGPFHLARAKPRAGALVEQWQTWPKESRSPYLVRGAHGLGCVTWVAQDLGDINLTGSAYSENWPHVWDQVIGWQNSTYTLIDAPQNTDAGDKIRRSFDDSDGGIVDFSAWLLRGNDFPGRGAAYVLVAVLFFIVYWIAAGPATYLYLSGRNRKELNWFIFGAWAFVATLLTILVVKIALRGEGEARHLSIVRQDVGQQANVYSRLGLYIPRDGEQTLSLADTSHDAVSYLTPLQEHPDYVEPTDFPAQQTYAIAVHDDPQPVTVNVPYRSTAKKLQAKWVGDATGINGAVKLLSFENGLIDGILTNQTGTNLKNIYVVFRFEQPGLMQNRVLFIPHWESGKPLDLHAQYGSAHNINPEALLGGANKDPYKGVIEGVAGFGEERWTGDWSNGLLGGPGGKDMRGANDFDADVPRAVPILSFFDLIAPAKNNESRKRVEFLRRGGQEMNMSAAVEAGKVVIVAQSADDLRPLPFPLTVDGSRVAGEGRVIYQFALTPDRAEMEKAARVAPVESSGK